MSMFSHLNDREANYAYVAALIGAAVGLYVLIELQILMWDEPILTFETIFMAPIVFASVASVITSAILTYRKQRRVQ